VFWRPKFWGGQIERKKKEEKCDLERGKMRKGIVN